MLLLWTIWLLLFAIFLIDSASCFTTPKFKKIRNQYRVVDLSASPIAAPDASKSASDSQFWNYNGNRCYYEVIEPAAPADAFSLLVKPNKKPEIILIHGFGCSSFLWRETKTYLSTGGYKVHALDLLGQGKSEKPGREKGIEYSISLWAEMVDSYAEKYIPSNSGVVLIGNSLGSCVALSAATGDFAQKLEGKTPFISDKIQGIGMYNCGVGMNVKNVLKEPMTSLQRSLLSFVFDVLDFLIFDNFPLLNFLLSNVVTKDFLKDVLMGLYQSAPDRVTDDLVESFYLPAQDEGSVGALNQIYTNDPGKTPMQFHVEYEEKLNTLPIHLIWGEQDTVTPIDGGVGKFYVGLFEDTNRSNISLKMIKNAGHVPFDEIPECNDSMVQWLNENVATRSNQSPSKQAFQWPFGQ